MNWLVKKIKNTVKTFFYAFIIAIVFRIFLFESFIIPSGSMQPNLLIGDCLFVSKYSYGYSMSSFPLLNYDGTSRFLARPVNRADVIVFKMKSIHYIKRVIGLPGDTVVMKNGQLFVNSELVRSYKMSNYTRYLFDGDIKREYYGDRSYNIINKSDNSYYDNTAEFVVPEGYYFVMGDNRDNSSDSRSDLIGFVSYGQIVGKAQIIFFSYSEGILSDPINNIRWSRLFKSII